MKTIATRVNQRSKDSRAVANGNTRANKNDGEIPGIMDARPLTAIHGLLQKGINDSMNTYSQSSTEIAARRNPLETGGNGEHFSSSVRCASAAIPAIQRTTDIKTSGTKQIDDPYGNSGATLDVGLKMEAELDPNDKQSGSKVSTDLSGPLQDYTLGNKRRYVQGHLLNSRLGGSGQDASNLTPLTYSANSTHFHKVEKPVIEEFKNGNKVEYTVEPDYSGTPRGNTNDFENGIETNFANKLKISVKINSKTASYPDIDNVPPYPVL